MFFVQKGGCNKALFPFTSIINYFVQKISNVYFCGLDATNAFDRINHFYLFSCLIDKGVPLYKVNTLHAWFRHMKAYVKLGNDLSSYFSINSGVLEGSLLGPRLYNIVIDKLLFLLQNSGLGCHIENLFAGAITNADDLIVLSASVRHLQLILDLCVDFGQECDIVFNSDKS